MAVTDPDILSIPISSGLSGTSGSARAAVSVAPEANITVIDTLTLSAASGWQVEAAARAAQAGWPREDILALLQRISDATGILYTLKELKYLIHGGRISHMKGLIASLLNIKPIIGVEKTGGTYEQIGQARPFKRAIRSPVAPLARMLPRRVARGYALGANRAFVSGRGVSEGSERVLSQQHNTPEAHACVRLTPAGDRA